MRKEELKPENLFVGVSRLFYACCALGLLLAFIVFGGGRLFESWQNSISVAQLKSYEELKSREGNFLYPAHLRFLASDTNSHARHSERRLRSPEVEAQIAESRRQVAEGVTILAKNLCTQCSTLDKQPVAPLLRIQATRRHPNQTFEPRGMSELAALNSRGEMPTTQPENLELGKPVLSGDDSLLGPELNATLNAEIAESVAAQNASEESSSLPAAGQGGGIVPLEPPALPPDWSSGNADVENGGTGGNVPHSQSGVPEKQNEPYDHNKGLEILRRFNQLARNRLESYRREVRDYSCILYKWDQTNITVDGMDVLEIKMRENPYSIYAKSLLPERAAGREFLYWEGHYNNQLVIFSGPKWNLTLLMDVDSAAVKNSASRSLLQLGFQKLLEELIAISSHEENFLGSEIRYYEQAKVGERSCYTLEVTFPEETEDKDFYRIQIFVDVKLTLPIQVIIYDWPRDGKPAKIRESYTYVITELNPGFTDLDFCHRFHEYGFKKYIPHLSVEEDAFMKSLVAPTSPENPR